MTISETYEYLNQIRRIESEIVKKQIKCEELRSCLLPAAIRYDLDKVQTTPSDQMTAIGAQVIDLDYQVRDLKIRKSHILVEISENIARLENDTEQIVLMGFYIGRMPMTSVAEIIHFSVSGTYKIRGRAVRHLADKMGKK